MDKREYNTIHKWVLRHYEKSGKCEMCNLVVATEWSNVTGLYIREKRSDWQELCFDCHRAYDFPNKIPKRMRRYAWMS